MIDKLYIKYIKKLNPNLRIFYTIRNPVDRAFSHLKLYLINYLGMSRDEISRVSGDRYIEIEKSGVVDHWTRATYVKTVRDWISVFSKE